MTFTGALPFTTLVVTGKATPYWYCATVTVAGTCTIAGSLLVSEITAPATPRGKLFTDTEPVVGWLPTTAGADTDATATTGAGLSVSTVEIVSPLNVAVTVTSVAEATATVFSAKLVTDASVGITIDAGTATSVGSLEVSDTAAPPDCAGMFSAIVA